MVFGAPAPSLAQSAWREATTPRFLIYSNGSERVLRDYADKIEVLDAAFWEVWGLQRPPANGARLRIYLVANRSDMFAVSPTLPQNTAGFYKGDENITFAMALAGDENDYVLLHEYTHHLMFQYFPYSYPAWLVEGYAEYFGASRVEKSVVQVGLPNNRIRTLAGTAWLPLKTILEKGVPDLQPGQYNAFYGESWLLTHYLLSDSAHAKILTDYLQAIAAGKPSVQAMEAATGAPLATLERKLTIYLSGQTPYVQFKREQFETPKVEVRTLSPVQADLLLDDLTLKTGGVPKGQGAAFLARVKAKAAAQPDDPFGQRVLARAEHYYGDKGVAQEMLKRRLAADPKDTDAIAIYADLLMDLGDGDPAKRAEDYNLAGSLLAASFKLDPTNYSTLNDFVHSRQGEPGFPSDNTLTAMLTAVKLGPQVASVRITAANGLISRKRYHEAVMMLSPLTNSPHDSGASTAARKLLEKIPADAR